MSKEIVFNTDGTLDEKSNRIVIDNDGYRGCWCTSKSGVKYFLRVGETPKEAWRRYYNIAIGKPLKQLKREQTLINKDGFVITKQEYGVLKDAVFKKPSNLNY